VFRVFVIVIVVLIGIRPVLDLGAWDVWKAIFPGQESDSDLLLPDRPQVELYFSPHCPASEEAKAYLDRHVVYYTAYDITDPDWREEFHARGGRGTPLLFVQGKTVRGFDIERYEKLFKHE
jgi:glutaredoxin